MPKTSHSREELENLPKKDLGTSLIQGIKLDDDFQQLPSVEWDKMWTGGENSKPATVQDSYQFTSSIKFLDPMR
jgi:hypothetical protein